MSNRFLINNKETTTVQLFLICCMLGWIFAAYLLIQYSTFQIFQYVNSWHTQFLDHFFSFVTLLGEFWLVGPVLLAVLCFKKYRNKRMLLALVICNLLPFFITHVAKQLYNAPRPMYYFESALWHHFVDGQPKQYHFSFPSGHTEGIFALVTFLVLLIPSKKWMLAIVLFIVASLVGLSRIYLSQHFLQDVLAGSMIGVIFCYLPFKIIQPVREVN